jgi:choline transporter-like protein 2/4/5
MMSTPLALLGLHKAVRYHFGSICLGTSLEAVVIMAKALVYAVEYASKQGPENRCMKMVIACAHCCLGCLQQCVNYMTTVGLVFVAMTGRSFCESVRVGFKLFTHYGRHVLVTELLCRQTMYIVRFCMVGSHTYDRTRIHMTVHAYI